MESFLSGCKDNRWEFLHCEPFIYLKAYYSGTHWVYLSWVQKIIELISQQVGCNVCSFKDVSSKSFTFLLSLPLFFFFKFSVSLKPKKYLPERIIQKPNTAVFQETNCIIHVILPTLLKRNIQFPRNAWPWTEFEKLSHTRGYNACCLLALKITSGLTASLYLRFKMRMRERARKTY